MNESKLHTMPDNVSKDAVAPPTVVPQPGITELV